MFHAIKQRHDLIVKYLEIYLVENVSMPKWNISLLNKIGIGLVNSPQCTGDSETCLKCFQIYNTDLHVQCTKFLFNQISPAFGNTHIDYYI